MIDLKGYGARHDPKIAFKKSREFYSFSLFLFFSGKYFVNDVIPKRLILTGLYWGIFCYILSKQKCLSYKSVPINYNDFLTCYVMGGF